MVLLEEIQFSKILVFIAILMIIRVHRLILQVLQVMVNHLEMKWMILGGQCERRRICLLQNEEEEGLMIQLEDCTLRGQKRRRGGTLNGGGRGGGGIIHPHLLEGGMIMIEEETFKEEDLLLDLPHPTSETPQTTTLTEEIGGDPLHPPRPPPLLLLGEEVPPTGLGSGVRLGLCFRTAGTSPSPSALSLATSHSSLDSKEGRTLVFILY